MTYIPNAHLKYDILPFCRKNGREVFAYPVKLLGEVDRIASRYVNNPDILGSFETLKAVIKSMICKEQWSILKYIGETYDSAFGLTHGKNYYWPCSEKHPVYEGVIDDEEYTSYLYSTDTGMAHNTIFK